MAGTEDMNALEYARHHGLAMNHLTVSPLQELSLCSRLDVASLRLEESTELHKQKEQLCEKLTVEKEAAKRILAVKRLADNPELDNEEFYKERYRWLKRRRVDTTLLRYDEQTEIHKTQRREGPETCWNTLPLEAVEGDKEVLAPVRSFDEITAEDIYTPEETAHTLNSLAEQKFAYETEVYRKNRTAMEHLTPPLLPCRATVSVYSPSPSETQLSLLSSINSLESGEFGSTIQSSLKIQQKDEIEVEGVYSSFGSIFDDIMNMPTLPDIRESAQVRNLRVSSPMLPSDNFDAELSRVLGQEEISLLQPALSEDSTNNEILRVHEKKMQVYLENTAHGVREHIENEKLVEADYKSRVEVPYLQPWRPVAPWSDPRSQKLLKNSLRLGAVVQHLESYLGPLNLEQMMWPGAKSVEPKLTWNPFPQKYRHFRIDEGIEDDNWSALIESWTRAGGVMSWQLTWKPEGLRILGMEDEEEELEVSTWDIEPDSQALTDNFSALHCLVDSLVGKQRSNSCTTNFIAQEVAQTTLEQFMDLRGAVISMKARRRAPKKDIEQQKIIETSSEESIPDMTEASESIAPVFDPMESLSPPSSSPPFFISSSLLAKGKVLTCLERLYPDVYLIERAFDDPSCEDADLILSPIAGILHSSVQRANQMQLPRSTEMTGFRGKVWRIAPKYERLFILLTNGEVGGAGTNMESVSSSIDKVAVADFERFAVSCSAHVSVHVVNSHDEAGFARWLASFMIRHGTPATQLHGLETIHWEWETSEEKLLRRHGLNAFSAVVILEQLGKLLPETQSDGTRPGIVEDTGQTELLQAFLDISKEERVRIFAPLIGGRKGLNNFHAHILSTL